MRRACERIRACKREDREIPAASTTSKRCRPQGRYLFEVVASGENRTRGTRGEGRVSSSMLDAAVADSRLQARRLGDY
jgi:hypothetical protein